MTARQTIGEEIANAISHGLGWALAVAGTVVLIVKAVAFGALPIVSVSLYGGSLILLYLFSTLYHSIMHAGAKKVLRVFDHSSIFLLILGSYIPVSLCLIKGAQGLTLVAVNLACAVLGIILNAISIEKWKKLSMALYVIMGWSIVASLKTVLSLIPPSGMALLTLGGVLYTLGIIFYKNKKIKYMHFVWHLFVLSGSVAHYFFILKYCL